MPREIAALDSIGLLLRSIKYHGLQDLKQRILDECLSVREHFDQRFNYLLHFAPGTNA